MRNASLKPTKPGHIRGFGHRPARIPTRIENGHVLLEDAAVGEFRPEIENGRVLLEDAAVVTVRSAKEGT